MKNPKILWQNESALVISKPAGLVVNRAETVTSKTLQDWVDEKFDFEIAHNEGFRNGIVHRLDKDTSGVMIIAKSKTVFGELQKQFRERQVEKTYLALVHGKMDPKAGSMSLPVSRSRKDRKKFGVSFQGRRAETSWKVVKYFTKGASTFSLVELYPKTGRTHQLRVHLKHLRYPIVGDKHYLSKKRAKLDAQWCSRQFLHALQLRVDLAGKRESFEAKLSEDLQECLKGLGERWRR